VWTTCPRLLRSFAPSRIWTHDLLIASPTLYPLHHRATSRPSIFIMNIKTLLCSPMRYVWWRGSTCWKSDLWSTGRGFNFLLGCGCLTTLGKLFTPYVPVTKHYNQPPPNEKKTDFVHTLMFPWQFGTGYNGRWGSTTAKVLNFSEYALQTSGTYPSQGPGKEDRPITHLRSCSMQCGILYLYLCDVVTFS